MQVHGIPPAFAGNHHCARSSKRTVRLISGVALDQCRVPERYRTRALFRTPEREVAQAAQRFQKVTGVSRWKRPARGLIPCPHICPCGVVQPTRLPLKQEITGAKPVGDASFVLPKHFERCTPLVRACLETTRGAVFGEKAGWQARRRRISLVDLRLRSNEARRPFPRKPSGRRVFCPWPALARSLQPAAGRCARPRPPWPQPKSLAAAPLVVSKRALSAPMFPRPGRNRASRITPAAFASGPARRVGCRGA